MGRFAPPLDGLIAAPFTPFTASGELDLPQIDRQCALLAAQGLRGAFICGTTGEGLSLTVAERMAVAERWLGCAPAGFAILAHAGALALGDARVLAAHAQAHGAHGVAVLAPCFLKPGLAALVEWIAAVAAACPRLPVTYYHIPVLTGVHVAVRELLALLVPRVPNLGGIKFTHEDLLDYGCCLAAHGDTLDLAYGRDEALLPALALGARCAVGSTYNLWPELYRGLITAFRAGDLATARAAQDLARRRIAVLVAHGGIPAMKAAMGIVHGLDLGPCRLPLTTLDAAARGRLERDLIAVEALAEAAGA